MTDAPQPAQPAPESSAPAPSPAPAPAAVTPPQHRSTVKPLSLDAREPRHTHMLFFDALHRSPFAAPAPAVPSRADVIAKEKAERASHRRVSGAMRGDLRVYNSPSAKTAGLTASPEQILKRAERFGTVTKLSQRLEASEKMEQRARRFGSEAGKRAADGAAAHEGAAPAKKAKAAPELSAEEEARRQRRQQRFGAGAKDSAKAPADAGEGSAPEKGAASSGLKVGEVVEDSVDEAGAGEEGEAGDVLEEIDPEDF